MQLNNEHLPSGQVVAIVCILDSTFLAGLIFMLSRKDQDMKLLALGAAISLVSALMATASAMLVGKTFDRKESVTDVPAGSQLAQTSSTTITTPVAAPNPTQGS